jgi:hypothetical protein
MTRHVIGALLVLAAQNAWAFNGCPPASADADKCQIGIAKALSKFGGAVIKCHAKQADGAFKEKPIDEETCEETGPVGQGEADDTIAKAAAKCPTEVVTNANTVSAGLLGPDVTDVQNGLVYCDTSSGTPIDPGGRRGVRAAVVGRAQVLGRCGGRREALGAISVQHQGADAAFKGKSFDEATCRSTATGKYDRRPRS